MKTMTVPDFSTPTIGRKSYKRFRGVDYSTDETQIDVVMEMTKPAVLAQAAADAARRVVDDDDRGKSGLLE